MKFSIGIPAYKATYLRECIDSVLAQTYLDYELIIVNDASPENIDAIVSSYHSEYIRYYKNEKNFGAANVVDNWNKCLAYATGNYFVLMGDDDKMSPDYLNQFLSLILKYPKCNVYHCRTIIINNESIPLRLTEPRPEFESVYDSILERMRGNRVFFISDYVYKTEVLKKNGGFYKLPLAWGSDDITSYIAAMDYGTAHTNEPLFMYRQSVHTISFGGDVFLKMDAILQEEKWISSFLKMEANSPTDIILKESVNSELRLFIQKKKIRTIYAAGGNVFRSFLKWFLVRNKYNLSSEELLYAALLIIKEKRKAKYE